MALDLNKVKQHYGVKTPNFTSAPTYSNPLVSKKTTTPTVASPSVSVPTTDMLKGFRNVEKSDKLSTISEGKAASGNKLESTLANANKNALIAGVGGVRDNTQKYQYLNPSERDQYNYYVGINDKAKADSYLKSLDDSLSQRMGQASAERVMSYDNPLVKGIASTGLGLASGVNRAVTGTKQFASKLAQNTTPISRDYTETAQETVRPQLTGVSGVASDLASSIGFMLPSVAIGGAAGPAAGAVAMGAMTAGDVYNQERKAGKSDEEASVYAVSIGALEGGLQYVLGGIGALGKGGISSMVGKSAAGQAAVSKIDDALKLFAKSPEAQKALQAAAKAGGFALKMNDEGFEEYLQDILNPVIRNAVLGENNQIKAFTPQALYSYMLGAITAGAFNAGGTIANSNINNPLVKNTTPSTPATIAQENRTVVPVSEEVKTGNAAQAGTGAATQSNIPPSREMQDTISYLNSGKDIPLEEIYKIPEVAEARSNFSSGNNTININSQEREDLRKNVQNALYAQGSYSGVDKDGKPAYNGVVNRDRRVDIVIGLPASGKSSVLVNPLSEQNKARVIDNDMAKEMLPEFNGGIGAGLVHREASLIKNRLIDQAAESGDNIVYPTLGEDLEKLQRQIAAFKKYGYSVHLHLNELSTNKAIGRSLSRFITDGRFIDPAIIINAGNKPTENYNTLRQVGGMLDGYSRYSNDVERGKEANRVEVSEGLSRDAGALRFRDRIGSEDAGRRGGAVSTAPQSGSGEGLEVTSGKYRADSPTGAEDANAGIFAAQNGESIVDSLQVGDEITLPSGVTGEVTKKTATTIEFQFDNGGKADAKLDGSVGSVILNRINNGEIKVSKSNGQTLPERTNEKSVEPTIHIDDRTYDNVSNRKVKSFQFEHPELHQYYVDAARGILDDLQNSNKGERYAITDEEGYVTGFNGSKRQTTAEIERLLDNANLTYAKIEKALQDIIADHGQENYAAAKKVELILDEMLSNGYTDIYGNFNPASDEYISLKTRLSENHDLPNLSEEEWQALYESEMPEGMGAASTLFDPYSNLQNQKSEFHPAGENAVRNVEVPTTDLKGKNISKTEATAMEAKATPDSLIPTIENEIAKGTFSYEKITDKAALSKAQDTIKDKGYASALADWTSDVRQGKVSKDLSALGWTLYNNAANAGDAKTAVDILTDIVSMQRAGAQATQAVRLLKKMSPEYQLYAVQRSVRNLQEELADKYKDRAPNLKIDKTLAKEYLDAVSAKDEKAQKTALSKIYKNIGSQIPSTFEDKWNAWRYIAMLGNPRTHIRNIVGNAAFMPLRMTKNIIAANVENVASKTVLKGMERTKAILNPASKSDVALMKSAWADYENVSEQITRYGKYDDAKSQIEREKTIFQFKPLETLRKGNTRLMDVEDIWFSQPAYAESLASYMKANKTTEITDNARAYAVKEAQKATYRDSNTFSDWVSSLGKNTSAKGAVNVLQRTVAEGLLPFKRTPANLLVRGVEYSPVGLVKSLTYDISKVKSGNMTAAEMIDNMAAGLTGTAVMGLGMLLASMGLISGASGDDEKQNNLDSAQGKQDYALQIGDWSYTLDWLLPAAMPLFVGVALYEQMQDKSKSGVTLKTVLETALQITNPVLETSMLSSLENALSGVSYAPDSISYILAQSAVNYLSQAVPTIGGQLARTIDDTRRATYTDKNSGIPSDFQYAIQKNMGKIPVLASSLQPYIDVWGREESTGNPLVRSFENFISPGYISKENTSSMEKELQRLYDATGESVLPAKASKYFTYESKRYDLTAEEYTKFATVKGQYAYNQLTLLVKDKLKKGYTTIKYTTKTDAEKAALVKGVYEEALKQAKKSVLSMRGITMK